VPKADILPFTDDLIGGGKDRLRNCKPERLRFLRLMVVDNKSGHD